MVAPGWYPSGNERPVERAASHQSRSAHADHVLQPAEQDSVRYKPVLAVDPAAARGVWRTVHLPTSGTIGRHATRIPTVRVYLAANLEEVSGDRST